MLDTRHLAQQTSKSGYQSNTTISDTAEMREVRQQKQN